MSEEPDKVQHHETLYRRVRSGRNLYQVDDEGKVSFEPDAFSDPKMRPSVDRACRCNDNPWHTKYEPSDGVTSITAASVRGIEPLQFFDPKQRPIPGKVSHADVEPVPMPGVNEAHAEIFLHPHKATRSIFEKLCLRLAYLASGQPWAAPPEGAAEQQS